MRRAILVALLFVALALDVALMLQDTRYSTALPGWLPEWPASPLPGVGERQLAAHWAYALALKPDHRLYGWGSDAHGGLVRGGAEPVSRAVVVAEGGHWRYVTAGTATSYAITDGGSLMRRAVPASAPEGPLPLYAPVFPRMRWIKVREVQDMTLALGVDGRLYLWSERAFREGQRCDPAGAECLPVRPDGTLVEKDDAASDAGPQPAAAVEHRRPRDPEVRARSVAWPVPAAADWTDFCLGTDGEGPQFRAYALNRAGELWRVAFDAARFESGAEPAATLERVPARAAFQRVYCPDYVQSPVFLLDTDQRLWGFGDNRYGALSPELETGRQLGDTGLFAETDLRRISFRRWRMIAPGYGYSLGISNYGDLWAWGESYDRDTGQNDSGAAFAPIVVDSRQDWVEVDTAGGYMVARDRQGRVYTWGANASPRDPAVRGLLADGGTAESRDVPEPIVEDPRSR